MLPRLEGREAEGGASCSDRAFFGGLVLRRRISGLCLSRLAFVGDANEGRFADAESCEGCSCGVASASFSGWTGIEVRGDVLRRFGAEVSIASELSFQLPVHGPGPLGSYFQSIDASSRVDEVNSNVDIDKRWGGVAARVASAWDVCLSQQSDTKLDEKKKDTSSLMIFQSK